MSLIGRCVWLLLFVASVSGCASGPSIHTDYDHQANFAAYKTFAFASPLGTNQAGYSTLLTQRLEALTRLQMEQRGYVFDPNSPDLLINFQAQARTQVQYVPPPPMPWGPNYFGYRMGWYDPWVGYGYGPDVIQYTQGVLSVDLIDARKKQLVWEGVATSALDDPQKAASERSLAPVVQDIFAHFPFLAGSGVPNKSQ